MAELPQDSVVGRIHRDLCGPSRHDLGECLGRRTGKGLSLA
jgi:hypothetical protein